MKMRIVALNNTEVFVQVSCGNGWTQHKISYEDFEKMMQTNFPKAWEDYQKSEEKDFGQTAETFFYHYKETEKMRIKGEAHIFEKEIK